MDPVLRELFTALEERGIHIVDVEALNIVVVAFTLLIFFLTLS